MKKLMVLLTLFAFLCAPTFAQKDLDPHEVDALEREALQQNTPQAETIQPTENKTDTKPTQSGSTLPEGATPTFPNTSTEKNILSPFPGQVDVDLNASIPSITSQNMNPNWGAYTLHFNDMGDHFYSGVSGSTSNISGLGESSSSFITSKNHIAFHFGDSNVERLRFLPTGEVGIGLAAPVARLDVSGDATSTSPVTRSTVTYVGNSDVHAIQGTSVPAPGYGYGVQGTGGYRGVVGTAQGTTYTGGVIGVQGSASNSSTGTAYGVYGNASTGVGGRSYGVYASGDLKASSQVFVGTSTTQEDAAPDFELVVDGETKMHVDRNQINGNTAVDHGLDISATGGGLYAGITVFYPDLSNEGVGFYVTDNGNGVNIGNIGGGYNPVNASAFNINSDRRLKKEINVIDEKNSSTFMNQFRAIESATYWYNHETKDKRPNAHIGVIAQSLPASIQTVMDKTSSGGDEKRLGVSIADWLGLVTIAVKENDRVLQDVLKENEQLKLKLKQQDSKMEALEKRMKALEK